MGQQTTSIGEGMPTIYDVARAAGVSTSTVSHVINGTRYVSDKTKQRVQQAMEQLRFRPNSLARSLVRQETRTIALIVPDNVNPFFAELARGIEDHGFEAGYNVLLCNSDRSVSKELAYLDMLTSKRVDGIIYMTMSTEIDQLQQLVDLRIPIVTFDREFGDIDAILLDNEAGAYDATRHLTELGHRRIGCIGGPDAKTRSHARVRGYEQALIEAGIAIDPELIQMGAWTYETGQEAAKQLFDLHPPPTAIFAGNDMMAIGAIAHLRDRGLHVPEDVSVVGFDNVTLSAYYSPPLTTMSTPIQQIGEQLCRLLLGRINNQLPSIPQRSSVRGQLVVRASTAPVRQA
jgi:LacI family transcriptional regulator